MLENQERPESGIYFKISKNTQYLRNTLYLKNIVNQKEHDFLGAAFFKSLIKKFAHEESYISIPLKRISLVNPI